ncbi:MAG: LD-carboxypeptidase [Alphaproteobacteria bacterium]|nr:LD-carboxypeptidase [Alphaproteobacteria bacterium]
MKHVPFHPLSTGDRVAIVSTSYWPTDEILTGATALIQARGLQPVIDPVNHDRWGPLAGTDDARLNALHRVFADPDIKAVILSRGGYGLLRFIDRIDFDLIRNNPKPFVAYSDLTPFLNYLPRLGIPTFHGPMARDWQEPDGFNAMLDILMQGAGTYFDADVPAADIVATGSVTAPICGGNLAMINSVVGTDYQIDMRGKILLIEDVCEVPYRIDRLLRHLKLANAFDGLAGVIIGTFVATEQASRPFMYDEHAMFAEYFANRGIPVVMNMPFGHMVGKRTLPIGASVIMNVTGAHVVIRQAAKLFS